MANDFESLNAHVGPGHKLEAAYYGRHNLVLECTKCNEIVISYLSRAHILAQAYGDLTCGRCGSLHVDLEGISHEDIDGFMLEISCKDCTWHGEDGDEEFFLYYEIDDNGNRVSRHPEEYGPQQFGGDTGVDADFVPPLNAKEERRRIGSRKKPAVFKHKRRLTIP